MSTSRDVAVGHPNPQSNSSMEASVVGPEHQHRVYHHITIKHSRERWERIHYQIVGRIEIGHMTDWRLEFNFEFSWKRQQAKTTASASSQRALPSFVYHAAMGVFILEPALARPSDETSTLMSNRCFKGDPITLPSSYPPHERNATSRSYCRARSALNKPVASLAAFFLCFITLAWLYFRPWSTVLLLDPARYHATLWRTVNESFPHNLHSQLITGLHSLESLNTTIPEHLFQTDKHRPTAANAETWIQHGFNRTFLNDSQAAQWVEEHFGGSEVARVYRELPLPVMLVHCVNARVVTALIISYLGRQTCYDISFF